MRTFGLGEGSGGRQIDFGVDAEQIQLRIRRHLVDDLGDAGSVLCLGVEPSTAEVLGDGVRGKIARGLAIGQADEAAVDDGHLHALAREALRVPCRSQARRHLFPADRVGHHPHRRANHVDGRLAAECRNGERGTSACTRLRQLRSTVPPAASIAARAAEGVGLDDDAHAAGAESREALARDGL